MNHIRRAINYVKAHIETERVEIAVNYMGLHRSPLYVEDCVLCDTIHDLMEEYGEENDLAEGWWLNELSEDEIVFAISEMLD